MKLRLGSLILGLAIASGVNGQSRDVVSPFLVALTCSGANPEWSLYLEGRSAEFSFQRESDLDLMLDTKAEGADWPRALTLIGRGDSAILIFEPMRCEDGSSSGPYSARILTRRGETPVLLTGCCMFLQG